MEEYIEPERPIFIQDMKDDNGMTWIPRYNICKCECQSGRICTEIIKLQSSEHQHICYTCTNIFCQTGTLSGIKRAGRCVCFCMRHRECSSILQQRAVDHKQCYCCSSKTCNPCRCYCLRNGMCYDIKKEQNIDHTTCIECKGTNCRPVRRTNRFQRYGRWENSAEDEYDDIYDRYV